MVNIEVNTIDDNKKKVKDWVEVGLSVILQPSTTV